MDRETAESTRRIAGAAHSQRLGRDRQPGCAGDEWAQDAALGLRVGRTNERLTRITRYTMVSMYLNSAGVQLEQGQAGIPR